MSLASHKFATMLTPIEGNSLYGRIVPSFVAKMLGYLSQSEGISPCERVTPIPNPPPKVLRCCQDLCQIVPFFRSDIVFHFTKTSLTAAIVAGVLSISAGLASAATVNFTALTTADLDAMIPEANITPTSTSPVFLDNVVGNQFNSGGSLIARSVWEDTIHEATGQFSSVQRNASATFMFADVQTSLNLIWGSPDDYNDITITLVGSGGSVVVNGADVQGPVGILASSVEITDVAFTTVLFEASNNAFEFANLTTTSPGSNNPLPPVPLPAGMLLMGTALAGFGLMSRRRKS